MPSWLGWPELVVIAVILLIIFGPRRLPELGHSIGKSITNFRKGLKDAEQEVKQSVGDDPQPAQLPTAEREGGPAAATVSGTAATPASATAATTQAVQAERDGLLLGAVSDGRIAPAQVGYYQALYDKDPEAVRNLLALAPTSTPAVAEATGSEDKPE
jgi:sec-independent protein translocase protein TatA